MDHTHRSSMIVKRGIPKMETFYALNMFFSEIIVDF